MSVKKIQSTLRKLANSQIAEHSLRFFKTDKGEYGERDKFLGIRMPVLRKHIKTYRDIALPDVVKVLKSEFHEERLFAVLLLVAKYKNAKDDEKTAIYTAYLKNTQYINNWDIVDSSAHLIIGPHLERRNRIPLYNLAKSTDLWEKRISIISTYHYIKQNDFSDTLKIAKILLNDEHDLIHKAVGWMLREIGNRNRKTEELFLNTHYQSMPRTMLRYAIEKFPEKLRQDYLKSRI